MRGVGGGGGGGGGVWGGGSEGGGGIGQLEREAPEYILPGVQGSTSLVPFPRSANSVQWLPMFMYKFAFVLVNNRI